MIKGKPILLIVVLFTFSCLIAQTNSETTKTKKSVLFVTAHPDDWEGCMGGTALLLAKNGYEINVLIATKGERGVKDDEGNKLTDFVMSGEIRAKEAQNAVNLIKGNLYFMGKIDGEVYADKKGVDTVVHYLNKIKPDMIFTMWGVDVPDHAATGHMAIKALWETGMIHDKEVYFMEAGRGGQTNQFDPDFYVDITNVYEEKLELVRCHESQNRDDRLAKIKTNHIHGQLARTEQAEAFKSYYPMVNHRWGKKIKFSLLELTQD